MLTFILQAAFPVGFNLHLAQVVGALVLQQSSLPLQLPQRGLDLLPAAHLIGGEVAKNNVSGMISNLPHHVRHTVEMASNRSLPPCLIL